MFTIKLVHSGGYTEVRACDQYVKTPLRGSQMPTITTSSRGEKETIVMVEGDTAFVENSNGKTIDVIRTTQPRQT